MKAAQGILTVRGGMTCHAAVVARGMGTCCVIRLRLPSPWTKPTRCFEPALARPITRVIGSAIDGSTGNVYDGVIPTVDASITPASSAASWAWADKYRKLKRAHQRRYSRTMLRRPRELGAEGIGLCRTEHMFFESRPHRGYPRDDLLRYRSRSARLLLQSCCPCSRATSRAIYEALEG